jgi:hypothetical protein
MDRQTLVKYISIFSLVAILAIQKPVLSQSVSRFFIPFLTDTWTGYIPLINMSPDPTPTPTPVPLPTPTALPTPSPLPPGVPPPYSSSIYMLTVDSVRLYNLGCQLGAKDRALPGVQSTIVILDFGSPKVTNNQYGTDLFWMGPVTITQIKAAVENFGRGYYICAGDDRASQMYAGIGTTNYGTTVMGSTASARAHGTAWAQMVNDVNSWLVTNGYSSQVHVVGATDIEPAWNSVAVSRAWVDGYDSVNLYDYYDFGTADGCATRADPNRVTCGNGWTREDVWYKAYGTRPAFPLPEIYNTRGANAEQWALISLYSVNTRGYKVEFHGVLTQWQACQQAGASQCVGVDNLPSTGWLQLYNELKRDVRTYYTPRWSSDMIWGYSVAADSTASTKAPEPVQVKPQISLPQQTVDSLQKALQEPALDSLMKSSLQEKLTNAKRMLADTAAGLANPAVKDPDRAPSAPSSSDTGFQVGIFEGAGGMIHPWEGSMINHWQDSIGSEYVLVSAGVSAEDATQGLVMVVRVSGDRQHYKRNFYQTPTKNGEIRVIDVDGTNLVMQAANGNQVTFDVLTNQFK